MQPAKAFPVIFLAAVTLASAETLLLLPISGMAINAGDMATINQLYRSAVKNEFQGNLLPITNEAEPCENRKCALTAAADAMADAVIYSTFGLVNSQWVFNSTFVKADGSGAVSRQSRIQYFEEMEEMTPRMAAILLKSGSGDRSVEGGSESTRTESALSKKQRSLWRPGLRLGLLRPSSDSSFSHLESSGYNYSSTPPYTSTPKYSLQPLSPIPRLSLINNFQIDKNLLLNTDLVWGIGADVGVDANLDYLMKQGELSPFVGMGIGVHHVYDDELVTAGESKRNTGLAATVQGGLMLNRGSDFDVMLRVYYQQVFNSDLERGVGFDVAVTFQPDPNAVKKSPPPIPRPASSNYSWTDSSSTSTSSSNTSTSAPARSNSGFFTTVGKMCVGCGLVILVIGLIGAIAESG